MHEHKYYYEHEYGKYRNIDNDYIVEACQQNRVGDSHYAQPAVIDLVIVYSPYLAVQVDDIIALVGYFPLCISAHSPMAYFSIEASSTSKGAV